MGLRPPNESVCPELDSGTVVNSYIIDNFLPSFLTIIILIVYNNQKSYGSCLKEHRHIDIH